MIKSVWSEVRKWAVAAAAADERRRVFWGSMMDVCEDRPELVEPRKRFCGLIEEFVPWLDFLLLTKRPENYARLMPWGTQRWPSNVWAGASAENQERFLHAVEHVMRIAAPIRWLSIEPLLSRLTRLHLLGMVDWVVVGGESGRDARPCNVEWIRSIVRQCQAAVVPVFVKQLGKEAHEGPVECANTTIGIGSGHYMCDCGALKHGEWFGLRLRDDKGGNMNEWPAEFPEIRVREFPKAAADAF